MNSLNFSRESWHHKLFMRTINIYHWETGDKIPPTNVNLCAYIFVVFNVCFKLLLSNIIKFTLFYIFFRSIIEFIKVFFDGFVYPDIRAGYAFLAAAIILSVIIMIVSAILAFVPKKIYKTVAKQKKNYKYDNFIVNAYRSFKNKICMKVTFND